jgi:hypothetical protein
VLDDEALEIRVRAQSTFMLASHLTMRSRCHWVRELSKWRRKSPGSGRAGIAGKTKAGWQFHANPPLLTFAPVLAHMLRLDQKAASYE